MPRIKKEQDYGITSPTDGKHSSYSAVATLRRPFGVTGSRPIRDQPAADRFLLCR